MLNNPYASFAETGLAARYRKAYEFCKEANFRANVNTSHPLLFSQFHPVSMAAAASDLGLPTYAVDAAILHDVVEKTPVDFDHLEVAFDMEVSELVYELSLSKFDLADSSKVSSDAIKNRLANASPTAQVIKQIDFIQTLMHLGSTNPAKAVEYAKFVCPISRAMDKVPETLYKRSTYICSWAKKRDYENTVNNYQHAACAQ